MIIFKLYFLSLYSGGSKFVVYKYNTTQNLKLTILCHAVLWVNSGGKPLGLGSVIKNCTRGSDSGF